MFKTLIDQASSGARPRWERQLDTLADFVEDRVIDPIDEFVTPHLRRHRAATVRRLARRARDYVARQAVRSWPLDHDRRCRLLATWAALEAALEHAHDSEHRNHADQPGRDATIIGWVSDCCGLTIQRHRDTADLLRALSEVERETMLAQLGQADSQPDLEYVPDRLRQLAMRQFEDLILAQSLDARRSAARALHAALSPHLVVQAADPLLRLYIDHDPVRRGVTRG